MCKGARKRPFFDRMHITKLILNVMSKDHPWIGVDAIIQNEEGKILLIQRASKSDSHPSFWGLIGGWVEDGETAEEAIVRECAEEIGVMIEVISFTGKYYDGKGVHPYKTRFALPHFCKIVEGEPKVNQPEEIQDVRWFSLEEIKQLDLAYDHKKMIFDAFQVVSN